MESLRSCRFQALWIFEPREDGIAVWQLNNNFPTSGLAVRGWARLRAEVQQFTAGDAEVRRGQRRAINHGFIILCDSSA